MAFRERARHECDDGSQLLVGEDRSNKLLVFDGPRDLETSIQFDSVEFSKHQIEFFIEQRERGGGIIRIKCGEIEREGFGAVTEWLEANAVPEVLA